MSRETEYKVWCEFELDGKLHKEMAGPENWFLLTQTGHLMSYGPTSFDPNAERKYKKLIPLFYTGFHDNDSQGDKIYKCDVINSYDGVRYDVYWDVETGQWWGHLLNKTKGRYTRPLCEILNNTNMRIIGNILSNPELLEAPK